MELCPKCNTVMEENKLSFDDMTEGQQVDYTAGFHDKSCPKCGYEIEQDLD